MKSVVKLVFSFVVLGFLVTSCGITEVSSSKNFYPQYNNAEDFTYNKLKLNSIGMQPSTDVKDVTIEEAAIEAVNLALKNEMKAKEIAVNTMLDFAKEYLGTRYRMGGTTKKGIDCSAFTQQVFQTHNITLPRTSVAQASVGERVERSELKKGDLLFFRTKGKRISHVAIVENINENGEVFFIHAATSKGVSIASLSDSYWSRKFSFAKRVL